MTKSIWHASIRAEDGSVLAQSFEGEKDDSNAWNAARLWLENTAVPALRDTTTESPASLQACDRFAEALRSQKGDIVMWEEPCEMRLEFYPADFLEENARLLAPKSSGSVDPALGF